MRYFPQISACFKKGRHRHDQVVAGLHALPNTENTQGGYRDELAGPRLQHETGDRSGRHANNHGDDRGIGLFVSNKPTSISPV